MERLAETRRGVDFVRAALDDHPHRIALVDPTQRLTYAEVSDRVSELGEQLGADRHLVALHLDRSIDSVVMYLAALTHGHVVLMLPGDHGGAHRLLDTYRPDLVARRGTISGDPDATSSHEFHPDLALLMSTSGTTGSPRLVRLSHRNLASNAAAIAESLRLQPTDRAITSLPFTYCYGLSVLHSHLHAGAGVVLSEASVSSDEFWSTVHHHGVTTLAGVPHTFDLLERTDDLEHRLRGLRLITQAGGRLAPDRVLDWNRRTRRVGVELAIMYGQTEATARMAVLDPELVGDHPTTVGHAIPGGSFSIEPDGALIYRGDNVMLGYADSPADLALGRTTEVDEFGEPILRTGDLAEWSDDGLLRIVGRARRIIKPLGLRIDLDELERDALAAGFTLWCAGEDEHGVLACAGGAAEPAVRWLIARTGLPRHLVSLGRVDQPPLTSAGKVDYPEVARLARLSRRNDSASDRPPDVEAIAAVFVALLGRDDVAPDDSFVSLEGDSLTYVEMALRLEAMIGQLPTDWHRRSIDQLATLAATTPRTRRRWARVEAGIVMRAAAMVLIVSRHLDLLQLAGGAHALLGLAGFNMARFQLDNHSAASWRTRLRPAARVAAPTIGWIAVLAMFGAPYGWSSLTLTHSLTAAPQWNPAWRYWFIEALVLLLVATAALMNIPAVRRLEQREPFAFALGIGAVTLLGRPDAVVFGDPYRHLNSAVSIAWLFALGWIIARSDTVARRAISTALVVVLVPGFFGDGRRDLIVLVGLLTVTWIRQIPMPRWAARATSEIAGASLAIYLIHWQLYPLLLEHLAPGPVLVICLTVGVGAWRIARSGASTVRRWNNNRSSRAEDRSIITTWT